jgi:hypothetical protein
MVVIFSFSAGEVLSFPLDTRQSAEFFLTSAMSVFAIILILPRLISWKAGAVLFVLFVAHLGFVDEGERLVFAYIFLGLSAGLIVLNRRQLWRALRGISE